MLAPLSSSRWTPDHAAHLLSRAGFGGTPEEVKACHARGFDRFVDSLLAGDEDADLFPPPAWTNDPRPPERVARDQLGREPTEEEKRTIQMQSQREDNQRIAELRTGWILRMRHSPHPLREKMTLFWHGHFATSIRKVNEPYLMWVQNETLRARALDHFGNLTKEISRDPAMIRWLDLGRSDKKQPNENFARELLELFTLGEGHYSEDDIRETARAFTGYRIRPENRTFQFAPKSHDRDRKKVLGRTGDFSGDDVIDIILAQPQCARFVGGRIWEFFAGEAPGPEMATAVAAEFRRHNYAITPFLRTLFRSEEFYAPAVMRRQIKSPVQWLVQTCKILEIDPPSQPVLDGALNQLGQVPFVPPNVRGWEGGRSWISSSTLVLRYNLAGYLAGISEKSAANLFQSKARDLPSISVIAPPALRSDPSALADALVFRLFGSSAQPALRERALTALRKAGSPPDDAGIRNVLHHLMSTPDYQLT